MRYLKFEKLGHGYESDYTDPDNYRMTYLTTYSSGLLADSNSAAIQARLSEFQDESESGDSYWSIGNPYQNTTVLVIRKYTGRNVLNSRLSVILDDIAYARANGDAESESFYWRKYESESSSLTAITVPEFTRAYEELQEIDHDLDRCPVLDEEDYYERESAATSENIKDGLKYIRNVSDRVKRLAERATVDSVWSALAHLDDIGDSACRYALESRDDQGAYPKDEQLAAALLFIERKRLQKIGKRKRTRTAIRHYKGTPKTYIPRGAHDFKAVCNRQFTANMTNYFIYRMTHGEGAIVAEILARTLPSGLPVTYNQAATIIFELSTYTFESESTYTQAALNRL